MTAHLIMRYAHIVKSPRKWERDGVPWASAIILGHYSLYSWPRGDELTTEGDVLELYAGIHVQTAEKWLINYLSLFLTPKGKLCVTKYQRRTMNPLTEHLNHLTK